MQQFGHNLVVFLLAIECISKYFSLDFICTQVLNLASVIYYSTMYGAFIAEGQMSVKSMGELG